MGRAPPGISDSYLRVVSGVVGTGGTLGLELESGSRRRYWVSSLSLTGLAILNSHLAGALVVTNLSRLEFKSRY